LPRGPGAVARAGHRAQPSDPPARATEQGRPASGPLAVRLTPRQGYPTAARPLGTRTLRRHGSVRPRGGFHHHPPAWPPACLSAFAKKSGGGHSFRPAGGAAISPEAAGTRRADRGWGVGDAVSCGHRGVPGPERAAGLQPEESRSAASRGEQAPSGRSPVGQKNHAVKDKKRGSGARPRENVNPWGSAPPWLPLRGARPASGRTVAPRTPTARWK
jgi:hypothetical protein